ncbi:exosortase family protein XrtF [Flavicella sediminum]|uniref:exosortase family protein XrtF n=1 Tax=Flavicella sediminum TaxID=2585141 RepID=UPI001120BB81|nr:exosortase family protein XrtF [Flavicella sediminum]
MSKRKSIRFFLLKFFSTYFLLFGLYSLYLNKTQIKSPIYKCAPITNLVASQTEGLLNFFGYNVRAVAHESELSVKLLVHNVYTARVIEGCNSISLIILFIAFIVAFPGSLKTTVLYALLGSVLIYGVNIFRIAFLTMALYKWPYEQKLLHSLVFPSIIYGMVFLLWVVWVNVFSNYKKLKDAKKV